MEPFNEFHQGPSDFAKCSHCQKDNNFTIGYDTQRPRANVKLHRKYVITTGSQLHSYLDFLSNHIKTAHLHLHFNQLKSFAEEEGMHLDWSRTGGRFLEAIHHITLDAHQLSREVLPNGSQRHRVRLSINNHPFCTFSRQWNCQRCRGSGTDSWSRDDLEEQCLHSFEGYRPFDRVIKACTVELDLGMAVNNVRLPSQTCLACGRLTMDLDSIISGSSQLTKLHVMADRCICPFTCLQKR